MAGLSKGLPIPQLGDDPSDESETLMDELPTAGDRCEREPRCLQRPVDFVAPRNALSQPHCARIEDGTGPTYHCLSIAALMLLAARPRQQGRLGRNALLFRVANALK